MSATVGKVIGLHPTFTSEGEIGLELSEEGSSVLYDDNSIPTDEDYIFEEVKKQHFMLQEQEQEKKEPCLYQFTETEKVKKHVSVRIRHISCPIQTKKLKPTSIRIIYTMDYPSNKSLAVVHAGDLFDPIERRENSSRLIGHYKSPTEKRIVSYLNGRKVNKGQSCNALTLEGVKRFVTEKRIEFYPEYKAWIESVLLPLLDQY